MAKGRKTGGKDFQPGVSGNPNGRPPLPQEVRDFRNAAKAELIEEFKYLWSLTESELIELIRTKEGKKKIEEYNDLETPIKLENNVPVFRKFIARAILKAVRSGEMYQINAILDRVIGKVTEDINHNIKGTVNFHSQIVSLIEKAEKGELLSEKINKNEKSENEIN